MRSEEVKSAMMKLKQKRAPGLDGIQSVIFQFLCQDMLQELTAPIERYVLLTF